MFQSYLPIHNTHMQYENTIFVGIFGQPNVYKIYNCRGITMITENNRQSRGDPKSPSLLQIAK